MFSAHLLDDCGGEIQASFFNEAVDEYESKLQEGKCYTLSRGDIKVANRQYNTCKHRYELVFEKMCEIKEADDVKTIQTLQLSVVNLRAVQTKAVPCTVDLCGVITNLSLVQRFISKDGKELVKRDITIADDTGLSLRIAIWGDRADQADSVFEGNPVVCVKGVAVKEWQNGRSGSLLSSGALVVKPTLPEAQKVQQWWDQGGSTQSLVLLSSITDGTARAPPVGQATDFAGLRRAVENAGPIPDIYSIFCRLAMVQTRRREDFLPLTYVACMEVKEGSNLPCNRRVDAAGFCAVCNRAGKTAPRLNLRCKFSDFADDGWVTTFHEGAKALLSMSAEEARRLDQGEDSIRAAALKERYFLQPLQVTVRVKLGSYNNAPRPDVACVDVRPVVLGEHARAMLAEIQTMVAAVAA